GIASVSLRSLAIAAVWLETEREQKEVLEIIGKIQSVTGWRVDFIPKDLKQAWGWGKTSPQTQHPYQIQQGSTTTQTYQYQHPSRSQAIVQPQQQQTTNFAPPQPQQPRPEMSGPRINPMYRTADFSLPVHPYQQFWVPPAQPPSTSANVFPNNINYSQYTYG
ncbi:hypothetical protein LTS18_006847, partial [Coniosporium uncinatum]